MNRRRGFARHADRQSFVKSEGSGLQLAAWRSSGRIEERRLHDRRGDAVADRFDGHLDLQRACPRRSAADRRSPARSSASAPATRSSSSPCRPGGRRGRRARRRATRSRRPPAAGRGVRRALRPRSSPPRGRRPGGAGRAACSSRERLLADEPPLVEADEPAETHLVRRVSLRVDQRLLAAEEIHVDQQQPGLDARDVERQHAGRLDVERLAAVHQRVPDARRRAAPASRSRSRDRRCSRCARCRPARRRSCRWSRGSTSACRCRRPPTARSSGAEVGPCSASAATSSEMSSIVDVEAGGVLAEPAQARIGRGPAERLLPQPRHRPVVDDLAVLVAPGRVEDLADGHLRRRRA